jgi:formylglycine-generating enzyme required for sulfatase activity
MKQNYKISLCALLLFSAASMMTARAQGSGNKPTLAVFVVGNMDNTLVSPLAAQLGANLTSGGKYTLTSVNTANKLAEVQAAYNAGGGSSIDQNALAEWGRKAGISAICLVVDDVKGSDHMFYAHLIDAKDSKVSGKGSYIRTGVNSGELPRVSLALAKQLDGSGRRRSALAPARNYPAELDIEIVRVEGGTFTMGCTSEQVNCNANEKPAHSVTLSSFSIGKYEITQAQWKLVMTGVAGTSVANAGEIYSWKTGNCGNVPCDDQRPAENMDWLEAATFCNGLSKKVGLQEVYTITGTGASKTVTWDAGKRGYRLPTEAEWEYAARGCKGDGSAGNATCENFLYSGSSNADDIGWYTSNSSGTTHPVGQRKPNALGIYDMSGNAWEWTYDWYAAYSSTAVTNPKGPDKGSTRVPRGGGYGNIALDRLRVAMRYDGASLTYRATNLGFRVVLPAQ